MTWGIRAMGWVLAAFVAAQVPATAQEVEVPDAPAENAITHAIGEEYTPCEDCPTFVRVPDAPEGLRPIRYVSKYELTWKNYLKSVDDGACNSPPIMRLTIRDGEFEPALDQYRLEWPIALTKEDDLKCYMDWLGTKTDLYLGVPSEDEWNWFARAGAKTNYPWGKRLERNQAAIRTDENSSRFSIPKVLLNSKMNGGPAANVGLFSPNYWGLYDIVGNRAELTSTRPANSKISPGKPNYLPDESERVVIKGISNYEKEIPENIFEHKITTRSYNGEIQWSSLAIRFVLTNGAQEDQ
jgi:hypothetical protein